MFSLLATASVSPSSRRLVFDGVRGHTIGANWDVLRPLNQGSLVNGYSPLTSVTLLEGGRVQVLPDDQ